MSEAREITVIIPTLRRPEMLRSALLSVASQTKVTLVREVLVSENSEDTASQAVCAEFASLPVRWIQPKRSFASYEHFRWLASEAHGPWLTWLGDDDMWSRNFIETAVQALDAEPRAVAFLANAAWVRNEFCRPDAPTQQTVRSIAAGRRHRYEDVRLIGREEMLLELLPNTPFSIWTLLARQETVVKAAEDWHAGVGWDADRWFLWKLVLQGPVAHSREILLYNRHHPAATSSGYASNQVAWDEAARLLTLRLVADAEALGLNPSAAWTRVYSSLDHEQRTLLKAQSSKGAMQALRDLWGNKAMEALHDPWLIRALRVLSPPLLWRLLKPRRPAVDNVSRPTV